MKKLYKLLLIGLLSLAIVGCDNQSKSNETSEQIKTYRGEYVDYRIQNEYNYIVEMNINNKTMYFSIDSNLKLLNKLASSKGNEIVFQALTSHDNITIISTNNK